MLKVVFSFCKRICCMKEYKVIWSCLKSIGICFRHWFGVLTIGNLCVGVLNPFRQQQNYEYGKSTKSYKMMILSILLSNIDIICIQKKIIIEPKCSMSVGRPTGAVSYRIPMIYIE